MTDFFFNNTFLRSVLTSLDIIDSVFDPPLTYLVMTSKQQTPEKEVL